MPSPARCAVFLLACILPALTTMACSGSDNSGPSTPPCAGGLVFTVTPVPLSAVTAIPPIGNLNPPVHTIPTDHGGMYVSGAGIPLVAPADARVTEISRTRYLSSPFRQGTSDFAVGARLCGSYELRIGHVATLVDRLASHVGLSDCTTYSTADETVEACRSSGLAIDVAVGEAIGTVGSASAGAFDLGLYDTSHQNYYVNPGRVADKTRTALCPYDPFPADVRSQLFARMSVGGVSPSGEAPVCGSMSVDVAGSARGLWVLQSNPVNQAGDETSFLVLAPHPMQPLSRQTFSAGPAAISAPIATPILARYPVLTSGRVNRAFADVHADGLIYCYDYPAPAPVYSYFVRLASSGVLTIQKLTHAAGNTPCSADPSTWSFGPSALNFIR